uniref:ZP domain-containing protein n=1 Tax=Anopheles culicifacies TaxID=139723 RepID=A0A182MJM3_9DIPT
MIRFRSRHVALLHRVQRARKSLSRMQILLPFLGSATIFTKEPTVRIQCQSGSMLITIKDAPANLNGQFSGMVYPKGLAKNSTCLTEYHEQEGPLRYKLPLKSCNTMPIETAPRRNRPQGCLVGGRSEHTNTSAPAPNHVGAQGA